MASYWQQILEAQAYRDAIDKSRADAPRLLGAPYRARMLLGDMAMKDNPQPNFVDVRSMMQQRGIDTGNTGGMPRQPPQLGMSSLDQSRNMMAMSADPAAVVQSEMQSRAAMDAPQKLGPNEVIKTLSGRTLASNLLPQKPPDIPSSIEEYNQAKDQGYPGTYLDYRKELAKAGSTNFNLNTGQRVGVELEKNFAPLLQKGYEDAKAARDTLLNTRQIRGIVDQGIITGTGANFRLGFAKALATAGLTEGEDVANTETFVTQMGRNVLNLVKGLGAGSGISNADLKFAERVAAGDITLNEQTIRRVLDIQEKAASSGVKSYNARFRQFFDSPEYSDALKEPYKIDMPDVDTATAEYGVASPKTDEDFAALPSGTVYIDPDDGKKYRKP